MSSPTDVTILSNLTLIQLSDTPGHHINISIWSLSNKSFPMATVSLLRRVAALMAMGMISYAGAKAPIQRHRAPIADFVFQNGSIYTLDAGSTKVSSLAIKNGVIISLGDDAKVAPLIGSTTQVLDLGGRMAMPGFVDPHMHALQAGQDLLKCNFNYQRLNVEQVLAHLQTCLDSDPERTDDDWLDGVALNYVSLALAGETPYQRRPRQLKHQPPHLRSVERLSHFRPKFPRTGPVQHHCDYAEPPRWDYRARSGDSGAVWSASRRRQYPHCWASSPLGRAKRRGRPSRAPNSTREWHYNLTGCSGDQRARRAVADHQAGWRPQLTRVFRLAHPTSFDT